MNYDPDEYYFRLLDQQTQHWAPTGKAILSGSVPAWTCECYHVNGISVPRCNNCGEPKPCMALVPYDSRFLRFDWGTVADAAEQSLINECKKLNRQFQATMEVVREANRVLAA